MNARHLRVRHETRESEFREFALADRGLTIGRGQDNQICLDDSLASRHHARLIATAEGAELTDLGSSNGTWIEEQRVTQVHLRPGSSFRIGSHLFVLAEAGFAAETLRAPVASLLRGEEARVASAPDKSISPAVPQVPAPNAHPQAVPRPQALIPAWTLFYRRHDAPGKDYEQKPLPQVPFALGRGSDNDCVLADPAASRHCARIERDEDGHLCLRDLGVGLCLGGKQTAVIRLPTTEPIWMPPYWVVVLPPSPQTAKPAIQQPALAQNDKAKAPPPLQPNPSPQAKTSGPPPLPPQSLAQTPEQGSRCPRCGQVAKSAFCENCGLVRAAFANYMTLRNCAVCKAKLSAEDRFCGLCGNKAGS